MGAIPRPLVWMTYKFIGLDKVFIDHALGMLVGEGKFLQMMTFLPFLPKCSRVLGPIVNFIKFSILPVLMLSIMTSMQAVPCNENAECVDISKDNMISFSRDLNSSMYLYVAIIVHTFVMIFAFALMACFSTTNKDYNGPEDGHEGELPFSAMSRFGKVLFAVLACLDIFMLGMGLFVIYSQISRSSLSISMAFAMAFRFDVGFSVDMFQILAALLIPVDLTAEILKKLKRVQQMRSKE